MKKITLKTLPEATEQEVFDYVANHLLTQNEKSKSGDDCKYHKTDGLKCAAGCLIDEQEYNKDFEGWDWCHLASIGKIPVYHFDLIDRLQCIHDSLNPDEWLDKLHNLAIEYGLSTDHLLNLS